MDERKQTNVYGARVGERDASTEHQQPQVQTALKALCAAAESLEQAISGIEVRFMSVLRLVPEGGIAKMPPDNQVELASLIARQASHLAEQAIRLKSIHDRCEL